MKKALRILICGICFATPWHFASATHIVGGEMIYACLGNDQYQVTLKVFRDCFNGAAPFDNPASVFVFDANGNQVTCLSLTLPGSDTLDNDPGNPCLIIPPGICVEEADYSGTVTLSPSPGGYTLVYQRCCRNSIIVNLFDPSNTGATDVAFIPDTSLAVCNSSPYFNNFPPTLICVDQPFTFDHSATDPDGDELVYALCAPFVGADALFPEPMCNLNPAPPPPYPLVQYNLPYSATDPMGGNPPMAIDPATGLLTVTPGTIGNFVV